MYENQHYVEVLTSISPDDESILQLRNDLDRKVPSVYCIDAERAPYHLTVAFMNEMGDKDDVIGALKRFSIYENVTLHKIKVFTERSGKRHVISLSTTDIPERFQQSVDSLRKSLAESGCSVVPNFMLHVTLGFVDAKRISLEELQKAVSDMRVLPLYLTLCNYRLVRFSDHKVLWDSSCPNLADCKFSFDNICKICNVNEKRILAHENLSYIMNNRKIRFINPIGEFDYTTFGNFVFDFTGTILLITKEFKYTRYHRWGILPYSLWSVVPCIFAGISTEVKDDTGREIFTGDIVTLDDHFTSMVHYDLDAVEPSLKADNCDYLFSMAHEKLHIEGTVFCNMSSKMFEQYDRSHISWYYSQFQQNGLSRDEVIRMAALSYNKPHFIDELNIIGRSPAVYSDIHKVMKGNFILAYLVDFDTYEEVDGNMVKAKYADNIPMEYEGEYYFIEMVEGETRLEQLRKPVRDFIDHAHSHPETVFILCDFTESLSFEVRRSEMKEIVRLFLPVLQYNLRNIILPSKVYWKLDMMVQEG